MFELNENTKERIVDLVREHFGVTEDQHSDQDIREFIDRVVEVVKSQFGF